jgi:NAD(P)-dependent dehydrogenase (short-subunit alcohol dehydrogenase family)
MQDLKNKVALVSGSGRGIGRAIALKLARHGAKVVVNDANEEPGRAVAEEIKSAGGEAVAVNGSVTDQGFPDRFVGAAMETFGGLDVIVNNAGYTWDSTIQKMTDEQFRRCSTSTWSRHFAFCGLQPSRSASWLRGRQKPVKRCSGRSSTFRRSPVFTATQAKPVIPPPKPRSSGSHAHCARNGDATRST